MKRALLTLYSTAFLHPGSGSATSAIDLPVQREVHTWFPYISGSGLKGCLREKAEQKGTGGNGAARTPQEQRVDPRVQTVFGPETVGAEDAAYAGCLAIGDARLLLMPVRSIANTFVWVTCPLVLQRLMRDAEMADLDLALSLPGPVADEQALMPTGSDLPGALILEDVDFTVSANEQVRDIAARLATSLLPEDIGDYYLRKFQSDLVVLSDNRFKYFANYGTQVSARIALNSRKTTSGDGGNLWYEETIPPEAVFYSLIMAMDPRSLQTSQDLMDASMVIDYISSEVLGDKLLRVGGNETVGQGWCLVRILSLREAE